MPRYYEKLAAMRQSIIEGRVTQTYGNTGFEANHNGVDLVLGRYSGYDSLYDDHSDTLLAPVSGIAEVKETPGGRGFGKHVIIHSPTQYAVLMGHMQDFVTQNNPQGQAQPGGRLLRTGDEVLVGDQIGHEDSTGWSTGKHVHYAVYHPTLGAVDPTLGVAPTANPTNVQEETAKKNFYYLIAHDLGFGGGDTPGQDWQYSPPPATGTPRNPVVYPFRRPDGSYVIPPPNNGGGGGAQPIPCPCVAPTCTFPDLNPTCKEEWDAYKACLDDNVNACQPSVGDVWSNLGRFIVPISLATVGVGFLLVGLLAFTREKPVQTIVQPVVATGQGISKAAATVAKAVV